MIKVACPCCGQSFSPEQASQLAGELSQHGGMDMDVGEPMEAKTMVGAMTRELDDPKKMEARAKRKE